MANVINTPLTELDTSWENYSGESIENLIKTKLKERCGYIYRTPSKIGDFYFLYGFQDLAECEAWQAGEDIEPMFKVQLPNMENDTFSLTLVTNSDTTKIYDLGSGVKINLRYTSTSTSSSTGEITNTNNEGILVVQRSIAGGAYVEAARISIAPTPIEDSTSWTIVDISDYLADGDNKIRLRVEDSITGGVSTSIVFQSIVQTKLKITSAIDTSVPLESMNLQYYIEGLIAKTLNLKITDEKGTQRFAIPVGDLSYTEVPYTANVSGSFDTGVKHVEAWLSVDGTLYESPHVSSQFYYVSGTSSESIIVLNNVQENVSNWINTKFFDFTVYNRTSDVRITIGNGTTNFIDYTYKNCEPNKVYEFYNALEIDSSASSINGIIKVYTSSMTVTKYITIDNSVNMSPTSGADFVLNPKLRNNQESQPGRIINAANNNVIQSTFTNFNFTGNDGWVSDNEGYGILRVPAGKHLTINYEPLKDISRGMTLEFEFKTYNIFKEDSPVFTVCNYASNSLPIGFELKALEAVYMTSDKQTPRDQDIMFQEDTRTHVAINIVPNLNNTGLNYIRLFINGIMNREMTYENSDILESGTTYIKIGSDGSDIDIYGIRVYKKALSATDVRNDYMASMTNTAEKVAFMQKNNILSANGTISYERCLDKYNVLVWTGQHPEYSTGKVKYKGSLEINILGDPAHSGNITNLTISGQGSSSRNYWKWNHQYDFNENSVWTDGNGIKQGAFYKIDDVDRKMYKMVAKLNWASSMQSHKMGSCNLFNDLWKSVVGGNSITNTSGFQGARVAIHEKPFLYFIREKEGSVPVFAGLMTFGSAKGDANTFGYFQSRFPEYLMIEGSDNGMPLMSRQVPWIDSEVTYDPDEEYWTYAEAGNIDYVMGKRDNIKYFKDAFNFTYQHSNRVKTLTTSTTLSDMNGASKGKYDVSYQYYNPSNYLVFRYDFISETWVNAGTNVITPCVFHYETKEDGSKEKVIDVYPVYSEFNIKTQTGKTSLEDIIKWRISDFKSKINLYYNTTDVLFCMAFLKIVAASDNRCKNTYEYLDPITKKICMAQDDLDTIMLTDNVGRKTKPYYLEEHDKNGADFFWNGEDNVFYNLMEAAFEVEERQMVKSILDTMKSPAFGGSIDACLQKYYFSTQEYFPSVAYNETARLLYEEASVAQKNKLYTNSTPAISQSLGDQLQAEKQWWKRRQVYLASLASTEPFYVRSTGALSFRSVLTLQSARPSYQFNVMPYIWLYPKVGVGQSMGTDIARVPAGERYITGSLNADGNTDIFIYGCDNYKSYGDFNDISLGEQFDLTGLHLTEFTVSGVSPVQFRPTSFTVNCPVLETLKLVNCSSIGSTLDLSKETKLKTLDLTGCTKITGITFPESPYLTDIKWPFGSNSDGVIRSFTLLNCPNLNTSSKSFNGISWDKFYSITCDGSMDGTALVNAIVASKDSIQEIHLRKVNLIADSEAKSRAIISALMKDSTTASGSITLNYSISSGEKDMLKSKYGDIDDPNNDLVVHYNVSSEGDGLLYPELDLDMIVAGSTNEFYINYTGNDILNVEWTIFGGGIQSYTTSGTRCTIVASNTPNSTAIVNYTVYRKGGQDLTHSYTFKVDTKKYIEEVKIDSFVVDKVGTYKVPVILNPSSYNIKVQRVYASITGGVSTTVRSFEYGSFSGTTTSYVNIDFASIASKTIETLNLRVVVVDKEGNEIAGNCAITVKNPILQVKADGNVIWDSGNQPKPTIESNIGTVSPYIINITSDPKINTDASFELVSVSAPNAPEGVTFELNKENKTITVSTTVKNKDIPSTTVSLICIIDSQTVSILFSYKGHYLDWVTPFNIVPGGSSCGFTFKGDSSTSYGDFSFYVVPVSVDLSDPTCLNGYTPFKLSTFRSKYGVSGSYFDQNYYIKDGHYLMYKSSAPKTRYFLDLCTQETSEAPYSSVSDTPTCFYYNDSQKTIHIDLQSSNYKIVLYNNVIKTSFDGNGNGFSELFGKCSGHLGSLCSFDISTPGITITDLFRGCTGSGIKDFSDVVLDTLGRKFLRTFYESEIEKVGEIPLNFCTKTNTAGNFHGSTLKEIGTINYDMSDPYAVNMFKECTEITKVGTINYILDSGSPVADSKLLADSSGTLKEIGTINFSNSGQCESLFRGFVRLSKVGTLNGCSGSLNDMFHGCFSLEKIEHINLTGPATFTNMFNNCQSLESVDYINLSSSEIVYQQFSYMFKDCVSLLSAPIIKFPTDTTTTFSGTDSFLGMFSGCTNIGDAVGIDIDLTSAIPSNTFKEMFKGCIALRTGIKCFTTGTPGGCGVSAFEGMYSGCYSLDSDSYIGEYLGTNKVLGKYCYKEMYKDCSSLRNSPTTKLPAVNLTESCYESMYNGCSNLVNAPELPALTKVTGCYVRIFSGCSKLSYVKMLATGYWSSVYTAGWLTGCADSGTLVINSSADTPDAVGGYGIPNTRWTVTKFTVPSNYYD